MSGDNKLVNNNESIKNLIYQIRGMQVMLDSDLAELYQVETKQMNRAAKRNEARFPEDFRFQLMKDEYEILRRQFGASNTLESGGRGGRRTLPFVYTEQGISMLAGILHTDIAIEVSLRIMRTFVEMRRFFANNAALFDRISGIELKQLEYQKSTDAKFNKVFDYILEHEEPKQKIFFNGQIYDAYSLIVSLVKKAKVDIILIDGYVDVATLDILSQKKREVDVTIYTFPSKRLTANAIGNFNAQYPTLQVKYEKSFHDRFLILDKITAYHIGASIKDAGKKSFSISLIEDKDILKGILKRLK